MQKIDSRDKQLNYLGEISFFEVNAMYNLMSQNHVRTIHCSSTYSLVIIVYSLKNVDALLVTQMLELSVLHRVLNKGNTSQFLFLAVNCYGCF